MDVNSREPSQNIIPFRIKGVEVGRFDICGNLGIGTTAPSAILDVVGNVKINGELYVNGNPLTSLTSGVVVNMDSQPVAATALNRQKKQSIPLAAGSTLATSDVIAKMSGVSVGKTQTYGVGPAQMASYGNIVVAVGEGTNSIAYSLTNPPTAASWVGVPGIFSTRGNNIAYANGTWVAVGEGTNSISYSTTTPPVASSWVVIPAGTTINGVVNTFGGGCYDITYGNGAWVAVGLGTNSIAYSLANPPTAESWVGIPLTFSPTIFGSNVLGITFGNGTWVATGQGTNGIAYSTRTPPTADSWVVVPLTNTNDATVNNIPTTRGFNVIFANGVWLAAGSGTNTLCYSVENPPIAGSWMPMTTGVLFGTSCRSLAYGNGTWVACGESGTLLAYSTSRIPHSSSWVAMKGPTPSSSGETINNVAFNAATNTWYFLGDIGSNCMFYSTVTPPVPATWIGVQRSASTFTTQAFGAAGITTNAFTSPINVARLDNKVTFPVNRMIAVGGGGGGVGGTDVLARSALTPAPNGGGTISYSDDDGATWTMVPGGATNAMFSSAADIAANVSFGVGGTRGANAVAWNGEKWVAAGNGRTNSLAFSDDGGMTWHGITGKSIFSVEARDVAWNGRMWVAVGRGVNFSTAYSYDGVTWMGPMSNDTSGIPINVFSYDIAGPTVTASMSDISGGGNHVIWTGKMWVATGTRTLIAGSSPAAYYTVAYSMDGKSWTGVPESGATSTGFDMYAHGIAWNGRNFVATGRGTVNTLAYFTDATATTTSTSTWQGLGNSVFSIWGRGITWGARRWMATGRGTNTVAYSTNGRNWQGCGANVFKPLRRFMAMGDTGLYTTVSNGQPQRGVAFSYSDDGITWDAPVVNQSLEFSTPLGGTSDATRSAVFTNNILLTNAITDTASAHTSLMFSADGGASWARVPGTSDTEANGGTGMTTANNGSYSLAMNTTRTRFLVGGGDAASATRKVYFSNDGFNWRNSVSSPNSTQMSWVRASLWVGGGYNHWIVGGQDATTNANGRIMYSGDADAVAAWIAASPATYTGTFIFCFAANSDFSVILAGAWSGNVIYRSVNGGANWTTVDISGTPTGGVRSIAFSPSLGRWVAVGGADAANTIIYSTDATGTAWIAPPLQAKTAATAIFKNGSEVTRVIWDALGGGRFIVGGWNGAASTAALTNVFGLDATANNNPGYTMAYSADGINWTPVTVRSSDAGVGASPFGPFLTRCREIMALDVSGDFTPINTGYSVTWNSYANRFVATGNGTTPVVYSSDGGVTWTPANQQPPQQAIVVAGGASAAANTTSVSPITYTIDGKTWFQGLGAKEAFGSAGTVLAVRYGQTSTAISPNGRIWVAGGTGTSSIAFSQNGIRWTPVANATTMMTNVRAIAYAAPAEQLSASASAGTSAAASGVGNGVWVAGGDTTNSLVFSYDGISWSEVPNSLTILNRCNAIAYGASGVFVAGGLAGTIDPTANMAYSTDGYNWQPIRGSGARISGSGASINCITYGRDENGRGLWVAGAFGSSTVSILYSYNGIDWVGVVGSGGSLSSTVTGLAYGVNSTTGRGLWVASVYRQTSAGYSFLFSTNGRDGWTAVANTKAGLFESNISGATSVAYLNGVWYATGLSAGVSSGRTLAYSYEGSSGWFGVYPTTNLYGTTVTTYSTTSMLCVATTGEYVGAAGAGALTPIRGLGWTAGVGSAYLQHPTLVFGASGAQQAATTAAMSTDGGRSWGASTLGIATSAFRGGVCNDALWNGIVWAAVGYDAVSGAKVATSKDGVTWTQIPTGSVPIAGVLYSIMWNGSVWMVGGDGSPTNDLNTNSIAWSPDLAAWTGIANTDTKLRVVKRIAWNGMYWVAVGSGDVSTIMHSRDKLGLVWEDTYMSGVSVNKTAAAMSAANDVVWGGGRWVAVGRASNSGGSGAASIIYSVDTPAAPGTEADYAIAGRRWMAVAGSAQLFPYGVNSVAWNGKRFIATGPASCAASTGNIIAWSADGIAWTAYSTAKTVAPGQRWVAVGSGSRACIALSADGRVWTDVSGSAVLFPDISGANAALVSTMKTGGRAIGWNGSSLVAGGARAATTVTASSTTTAATMATTGRTTIPVCAFIGSGNGVMGGGTTNAPMDATAAGILRTSSSVFITHMDVNMRESSAPWANMWLNTYTDLSGTQLFQVTPETQTFSSALKWNGWSWVANFGMTTFHPQTGEQYGSIWYCSDPLARVGWSVASNSIAPRILIGQGGYAALEWNGVAWLACGYDPNNNNMIYTTDRYGATGWTAVSGTVSGAGSASFQPVCIASSSRFWVVGGSQGAGESAIYYTSDRTGATGWRAVTTTGVGASVLPAIRITSMGYNGTVWICCGGGRVGTDISGGSISWRADLTGANAAEDFATGWTAATVSGTSGGIPPIMSASSAIATNAGAGVTAPIWVVVGEDLSGNGGGQIAYTTDITGSSGWKKPATGTLPFTTFGRLNGIAWTGYSWIATSGAGFSRLASTTDPTAATQWNNTTNGLFTPTLCTNAVAFVNIPISLLTTGMPSSAGVGAGTGAMWRAGAGRAQGLLPGGGTETTSVVVRSSNGAEGTRWSQTYSRNFLIAVGGSVIRDASGGGGTNRMAYSYDGGLSWTTNNTAVLTSDASNVISTIRTVKYGNGMWVAGGDAAGSSVSGNNCLAWSRDGVNWVGAGGTQIFGSAGACYAVCCNDRGRWVAVGGAPLGTVGTYTNTSGSIYTMAWSDDGMNWTPILGSRALFGIVCQGVSYGADASGVGMWTAIGRGGAYTGCAYSYDGKTWYLSQTSGSLFGTSANVLTERYAPVAAANWRAVSLSSTGQYQTAVTDGSFIYTSSDYGLTWTQRDSSRSWLSVSLSSTGQYQTAMAYGGQIHTSSDFGINWTPRYNSANWRPVSLSSTGQYQTAAVQGGQIHTSSDYGINWTPRHSSLSWQSISLSSTGQYQTAVVFGGQIHTSSDFGINWTPRYNTANWVSVSLSSTGQYQTAAVQDGKIHTSSDFGINWTPRYNTATWGPVSLSSTGQYQTAVVNGGQIHTSSDFGTNWTPRYNTADWRLVSLSSTGQYQTAVVDGGLIYISSNFGETWSAAATDSRSLGVAYGKDASGVGMWVATAGRRDRDISASVANTMAYSYDGKLWRGIRASVGLSEQAWSVAYGKDGFGVGMWVAAGYDTTCGLKWSYDGVTWNATMGASGAAVWAGMAAGRRALAVYWNGSMWLASTSDTRNGEPRGTSIAANNASSVPGYLLYSYNGKNWLPVLAPNTYGVSITGTAQASVYSVLPNPAILDFGSFYDDQSQRGVTIANTTARTVGAVMSGGVPIENVNTIVPYGRGSLTTGQVPFLLGGDSGLMDTAAGVVSIAGAGAPPPTSELASTTASLSTSTDGGITWRAVPNSTRVMTKVNKILCDETTQQIVAVGTGNYSVATSTPSRAADADGWVGVFGSRMTDTRAGLFEKYGTGASWFGGAKMWIASGRAQTRRGSSLAVSVNGTVWQDAKIVSQVAAGTSLGGRGGGLVSRTTGGAATTTVVTPITVTTTNPDVLYTFTAFTFDNAGATGRFGPDLSACRTRYASTAPTATWAQNSSYLNMTTNGIQLWTVPATGSYTIRAVGAGVPYDASYSTNGMNQFQKGMDATITCDLSKNEVIRILVGQIPGTNATSKGGAGGTFVVRGTQTPIIVAGGGGGRGESKADAQSNTINSYSGQAGSGNYAGTGGSGGGGGGVGGNSTSSGGGGLTGNGANSTAGMMGFTSAGGLSFTNGGLGGLSGSSNSNGGFGGGGSSHSTGGGVSGGGGGGYSGGGAGGADGSSTTYWTSGGGGGSFSITGSFTSATANNNSNGSVTITPNFTISTTTSTTSSTSTTTTSPLTFNSSVIPYTSAATPLLTYTDSAAAFSTQVGSVAVNSQYNRAVVGGSGVQFVAGGRGGIAVSNDGQNWTAAAAGTTTTVFQTPTNTTTRTGSGGFDASFGTVALTQRLTTPATYPSGSWLSISLSSTGQYQSAVIYSGGSGTFIYTSSDYGVSWTQRTQFTGAWHSISLSSTGQYQSAVIYSGGSGAYIYTSSDYGVSWTQRTQFTGNWLSISLSSTGQYQSAVIQSGGSGTFIYTSSDYGVSWTQRTQFTGGWRSISLSSTGQYQSAVIDSGGSGAYIYTSSDYGVSWTQRTQFTGIWYSISLSSTGQYQSAVIISGGSGAFIYTSSDYGVSWTQRTQFTGAWRSISLSSTGQYQSAVIDSGGSGAFIYTSSDYGVSWTQRTQFTGNWLSISLSSTGQYQSAVIYSGGSGTFIYTSTDFGVTWVQRSTATRTNAFTRIKSSASGQYQLATSGPTGNTNGQLYVSSDYGRTWMPRSGLGTWLGGAVSVTGAVMTAFSLGPTKRWTFTKLQNGYGSLNFYPIPANNNISLTFNIRFPQNVTVITYMINGVWNSLGGGTDSITDIHNLPNPSTIYISFNVVTGWKIEYTVSGVAKVFILPNQLGVTSIENINNTYFSDYGSQASITGPEIINGTAILRSTDYGNTFTDVPGTALTHPTYWRAIAATNSAATQTALAHGSTIYRSTDYGSTWNSSATVDVVGILTTELSSVASPTLAWKSIAMSSSDAKIQTGVVANGQIYVNSNYGREAWTAVDSSRNWTAVAMSADGRYQSAVVSSGAIYYNSTSGTGTWTAVSTPAPGFAWTSIAVSSADGKYQTAVASGATNIYVNSNFGVGTWTSKESARNWFGVAMSATGQYQTAINRGGFIYIDASFGAAASWTPVDFQRDWASVAMSSTGQYQTAVVAGGKIYVNSNYGAHGAWTETESNRAWISVAVSGATGRYQTAVAQNAQIYTNANFGVGAWFAVDSSRNWVSVTVSADGKYQSAAVATSGQVYFSRDFGATWSTTAGLDIMGNRWQDVALSAETGAVQVTCVSGGYLYVSSDTGANWVSTTVSIDGVSPQATNRVWQAVAVSANGQYGLACVNSTSASGFLYRSTNAGASWSSSNVIIDGAGSQATNRPWQDVGMSANGKYQVACLNTNTQTLQTTNIASAVSVMVPPPGALATTFGAGWTQRGQDIDGEAVNDQSGYSVALSADGSTVAIGAFYANTTSGTNDVGHVRVYKYNSSKTVAQTNQSLPGFGPIGWDRLGDDIDGEAQDDQSGWSVALSADGSTVAIGARYANTTSGTNDVGHVRVYKYNSSKTVAQTNQSLPGFGPIGWDRLGDDIDGEAQDDQSGWSVALSADGSTVAIGARYANTTSGTNDVGHVRVYKYNSSKTVAQTNQSLPGFGPIGWDRLGDDIDGEAVNDWSGWSVALSADGSTVAIGARLANTTSGTNDVGHVRVYKYNSSKTVAQTNQSLPGFGPIGWDRLGDDIDGEAQDDQSGYSVALSADGSTVAIGAPGANTTSGTNDVGHVRVYKYNSSKTVAQTNQSLPGFGPIGWDRLGDDIDGEAQDDQSGFSVALSADGSTVAIGAPGANTTSGTNDVGHVRVYKYNSSKTVAQTNQSLPGFGPIGWDRLGDDIDGEAQDDQSGYSVALSADGSTVAIGARLANTTSGTNDVGHVRVYNIPVTNAITYTSSNSSVADICGNLLLIKGAAGTTTTNIVATQGATTTNGTLTVSGTTYTLVYTIGSASPISFIYYSKNYGASWTSLTAAGSRSWSSVALSENGSTISATTNDASGGVWVYSMPDDQYYRAGAVANAGGGAPTTTPATVRAIAYGNSGTGAAVDGYWVAGADASANSLAYSSNGVDWTAVVGSKTTLFNTVNGVAYGADTSGTPLWVAVGLPFVGSVPGSTAYSIAYSYNMATWTGVRNAANFTGQGNHVAYGQDEFGAGVWVAVGQGDGVLSANLGDSSFYNSNGATNTTIFYSYDGANWAAGTGLGVFAVSGTDVTWGVDASGVGMWVATGIGYTDPLTGVIVPGGQVAHSVNGRVWTPIRTSAPITPAMTPVTLTPTSRAHPIPLPPASTGVTAPVYGTDWGQLGADILGTQQNERNGQSVSISADGTTVAIGSQYYDVTGSNNEGRVRIYKYNGTTWGQLGLDITGTQTDEQSGQSVSLSADGTTVAIGSYAFNIGVNSDVGRTRIYKYNGTSWIPLGLDISGNQTNEQSGWSVSLSADGTTVAVGSRYYGIVGFNYIGRTRIYKYNNATSSWIQSGLDISGNQASEQSGYSVSLSADGNTVAIGSPSYKITTGDEGRTRIFRFNGTSWNPLGADISGTQVNEQSGYSVSLSADGNTVAIGSSLYDKAGGLTNNNTDEGRTRIYKYNGTSWNQLGLDISGNQANENSGQSVNLSADGTTVAIGSYTYDVGASTNQGRTRIYKFNNGTSSWIQLGLDILGNQTTEHSGWSVSLSADGTTVGIGSYFYDKAGGTTDSLTQEGRVRIYKIPVYATPTYTSSNPAVAEINNGLLFIKQGASGTTTITATQPATPPFTAAPVTVQGTLDVSGTTYTLVYHTFYPIFTPFPSAVAGDSPCVAYGRGGSQGTGAPLWMVANGGGGTNVFAMSSAPTTIGAWSVVASNAANAPFPTCNSLAYSNGVWVAGNNTTATNLFARSTDGGATWTPVTASSVSGILTGAASIGANAFCNYSLAVADFSNDTNMRSWVAVQGTKNFFFEGGVSAVATVTPDVSAAVYNAVGQTTSTIASAVSVMVPPPGALTTTFGEEWPLLGPTIPGVDGGEESGYSVSLSADGTTVAIGAYVNSNYKGITRIYKYNAATETWPLLGPTIPGVDGDEQSGRSVSLSADGTTVAIGAYANSNYKGITRIYKYNAATETWPLLGPTIPGVDGSENSGWSVSLSADGTTVAIGARANSSNKGITRIYKYNTATETWLLFGPTIPGVDASEESGRSVSLSADGTTVAIGAWVNSNYKGITRIYKYNAATETWPLLGPTIPGVDASEQSGYSVSLSADGTTVAIGAYGNSSNKGITRIYKYNAATDTWPLLGPTIPGVDASEQSGWSVSLSADGTTVAIGARTNSSNKGITRIYKYNTATETWPLLGPTIPGVDGDEQSGWSVSLSADGTTVAIGARANSGAKGITRIHRIPVINPITYTSSNTSVAEIYANALLLIKSGASGTTNITATQGSTTTTGTLSVSGTTYTLRYGQGLPWWVAGGVGLAGVASLGSTTDPSGATGWTKATSPAIANLAGINAIAFSPHTQRWLAVGAGASGSLGTNILYSDASGTGWTAGAVTSALTPVITLNTCVWNQAPASASSAGRWLVGGTRNNGGGITIADSASLYISTDASGAATPWTPIVGTGAILSQVYSLAFNGNVWIAAGAPATDNGSTSTLMRTADATGATGWHGIAATNASTSGFDTAARSVTWNADEQMWVATGENTGSVGDASFSSVIYSRDVNGALGTWRTVRESNSVCFSGEGTGIAFTGDKWFAVGDNGGSGSGSGSGNVIVSTSGPNAAAATTTWAPVTHGTALTRASDIAYTGRRLVASGASASTGTSSGLIYSADGTGSNGTWTSVPNASAGAFNDALGGATSITFEASYEGTGRIVATGRSATNAMSVSTDGGETWTAPSVQYSSSNTFDATTTPLFTTGGNSVAYVGNDTLFAGGGNDVHWNGKRWVATGRNSANVPVPVTVASGATLGAAPPDVVNNNTAPIATSEDGITWQCVRASQAPTPLTEGTFIGTNSRIGATPLINSQIVITDGGDTESVADYGGGGSGTGVAQIDIIAELTPVSNAAGSVAGTVGIIGAAGNGGTSGVGNASTPSFDNTAFTITTRPM